MVEKVPVDHSSSSGKPVFKVESSNRKRYDHKYVLVAPKIPLQSQGNSNCIRYLCLMSMGSSESHISGGVWVFIELQDIFEVGVAASSLKRKKQY